MHLSVKQSRFVVLAFVALAACETDRMAVPRVPLPADSAELLAAGSSSDRAALTALYLATDGPNWTHDESWLTAGPLDDWYGVKADSLDQVERLRLRGNGLTGPLPSELGNLSALKRLDLYDDGLTGPIPPELGDLAALEWLWLGSNALTGPIPPELGDLAALERLGLYGNGLTGPIPPELGDLAALKYLSLSGTALTGPIPPELGNLTALESLTLADNALTGPIPPELGNLTTLETLYLSYNALTGPIPPELGDLAALESLYLGNNSLTGPIPPELGNLTTLETLYLSYNALTGPIPPELGDLAALEWLWLGSNGLTGPIPPELGDLASLKYLSLSVNDLTGPIPLELGNLTALEWLGLHYNALTGPIPPELGDLASLEVLQLHDNDLTGPIPAELGNLTALRSLWLAENALTGAIPPELGNLAALEGLYLWHTDLVGALPGSLTNLHRLRFLDADGTGLCAPSDPAFVAWLEGIQSRGISQCEYDAVYLTQAVQSLDMPVPLVAGEEALLRVFVTASANPDSVTLPPVLARFYVDGAEVRVEEIPAASHPVPTQVDESDLAASANAQVSGDLVRPGLELVIEIDPDSTLDPSLGVERRIPEEGRLAVDVREMPVFDLTIIPFLWTENPDSSLVDLVEGMSTNPQDHEQLRMTADLLPVGEMRVTAHAPVETSSNSAIDVLDATYAIRAMEGGTGYWMGMLPRFSDGGGVAYVSGTTSASVPRGTVIAHELGHNFSLWHAPCGGPRNIDPNFPDPDGRIGAWGYDFATGQLVPPDKPDLMSYCGPKWISDYHFTKALQHRLRRGSVQRKAAEFPVRSLLLWGGVDSTGVPYLEPAVVVDAPPSLPESGGTWTIEGRSADGAELFSLPFDMPEIADAGEGAGGFTFVLPAGPGWEALASVTLSGPGGTATLDADTDRPLSIWRDGDGQVRAILRRAPALAPDGTPSAPPGLSGLSLTFSRGIPSLDAWRR